MSRQTSLLRGSRLVRSAGLLFAACIMLFSATQAEASTFDCKFIAANITDAGRALCLTHGTLSSAGDTPLYLDLCSTQPNTYWYVTVTSIVEGDMELLYQTIEAYTGTGAKSGKCLTANPATPGSWVRLPAAGCSATNKKQWWAPSSYGSYASYVTYLTNPWMYPDVTTTAIEIRLCDGSHGAGHTYCPGLSLWDSSGGSAQLFYPMCTSLE